MSNLSYVFTWFIICVEWVVEIVGNSFGIKFLSFLQSIDFSEVILL